MSNPPPPPLLDFLRTHDEAFRSRARLSSLYADFSSQRTTNPEGYLANSSAWIRALSRAARDGILGGGLGGGRFVIDFRGEKLLRELECKDFGGRPLALGDVVEDAVRAGEFMELGEFLGREGGIYAGKRRGRWGWRVPTVGEVLGWGLGFLPGLGLGRRKGEGGRVVVVGNVEAAAKTVLEHLEKTATSPPSRIFSRELFERTFAPTLLHTVEEGEEGVTEGPAKLTPDDLSILLTHLSRDHEAAAYDPLSGTLKFHNNRSPTTPPSRIIITEEDKSIASLRTLISTLEPQISDLVDQISTLDLSARESVAKKQLHSAKISLRKKKAAEGKLSQRSATLVQLEDVYANIERAGDQVELVKVLEQSGGVLKKLNEEVGGVERVEGVLEGLREGMEEVEEVGRVIAEGAASGEGVDEEEVEEELEALERGEREKREAEERVVREEKEGEERRERAKREAEETEVTRKKLAELESPRTEILGEKKGGKEEESPAVT